MNLRRIAKRLLPPVVADTIRTVRSDQALRQYLRGGRVPWSRGFAIYKRRFLAQALRDGHLLECFRRGEPLPTGYGIGMDERCVEYLWLLTQ